MFFQVRDIVIFFHQKSKNEVLDFVPCLVIFSLGETNLISRLTGATDRDLSKIKKIIIFCLISVSPQILFLYELRNVLHQKIDD